MKPGKRSASSCASRRESGRQPCGPSAKRRPDGLKRRHRKWWQPSPLEKLQWQPPLQRHKPLHAPSRGQLPADPGARAKTTLGGTCPSASRDKNYHQDHLPGNRTGTPKDPRRDLHGTGDLDGEICVSVLKLAELLRGV